jgi:hypothetical protein
MAGGDAMNGYVEQLWQARRSTGATATQARAAMARVLRCDPGQSWALAPFEPLHDGDRWWIAATEAPQWTHCEPDLDLMAEAGDLGDVLLIDGRTGAMMRQGEPGATGFYGAPDFGERCNVYSNGITFARAWAANRQAALDRERLARKVILKPPNSTWGQSSFVPGFAMIGDAARISNFEQIADYQSIEIDTPHARQQLAGAMLRAARLPVVVTAAPQLKAVS